MAIPLSGLTSAESRWIEHIHDVVVPRLLGNADERARTAAIVTWWALKEGVLDVRPNPWRQNVCHTGGDHRIGDLEVCSDPIWQVGMAGIQPSAVSLAHVEDVARRIYPGYDLEDVLRRIAEDAAVVDSNVDAIATSDGTLRKAWLLRDPAIAFTIQAPFVEQQCIRGSYGWCYGSWDTARRFASDKDRVQEVIGALTKYYEGSPGPSTAASAKKLLPFVLLALAGGAYYLYSTRSGKQVRRRIETRASRLFA